MGASDPGSYGRAFAEVYDDWYADVSDVEATVATLTRLAGHRRALELGVGTGRLALPLSEHCDVDGIDASEEMLAVLRAKPGAEAVDARLGDMTDVPLTGPYGLVVVAFNTFFNLPDDTSQQACLGEVRRLLADDGRFVIEAVVPLRTTDMRPSHHDERRDDGAGGSIRTLTTHEPATRSIHGVHVHTRADGSTVDRPWRLHYRFPEELDSACRAAGLVLVDRWSDWDGTPFGPGADRHVSVYRPVVPPPLDRGQSPKAP